MFGISEFHRIQFLTIGWRVLRIHTPDSGEKHHHNEYHFEFSLPSNIFRWLEIGLVCCNFAFAHMSHVLHMCFWRKTTCNFTFLKNLESLSLNSLVWHTAELVVWWLSDSILICLITRVLVWYRFFLSDNATSCLIPFFVCLVTVW